MNFQPNTTVYFCRTGITQNHKVFCRTKDEQFDVILRDGNLVGRMTECSFQRADLFFTIRVDHSAISYYQLMQCDTVFYNNEDQFQSFWIVGNIVAVEWKNEECSFVRFTIDPFMTYSPMIDWDSTYAYILREHVKNDWSSAMNPLFSNIGPAEDFHALADTPIWTWNKVYHFNNVLIQSPYDESGKPSFSGSIENGLYNSMTVNFFTPDQANQFFDTIADSKDASLNNIVGVYGIPDEILPNLNRPGMPNTDTLEAINIAAKSNPNVPDYNNAKCWSAPYCNIRILASNGSSMDFTPQWFGNDIDSYDFLSAGRFAGKQFGGIAGTFKNKNGIFDWKAWNDFIVMLDELPRCYWTADGFSDWQSYSTLPIIMQILASSARSTAQFFGATSGGTAAVQNATMPWDIDAAKTHIIGGAMNAVANQVSSMASIGAQISQNKATGATVQGGGSFSGLFDICQDAWGFKVVYYMAQPYIMNSVDAYFDRFGYRVNRLKKLDLQTRPVWNFIQTAECHVAIKTGIPIIYETAINNMFNAGVTIWNKDKYSAGRKIGDFSNPKENRGIEGGN